MGVGYNFVIGQLQIRKLSAQIGYCSRDNYVLYDRWFEQAQPRSADTKVTTDTIVQGSSLDASGVIGACDRFRGSRENLMRRTNCLNSKTPTHSAISRRWFRRRWRGTFSRCGSVPAASGPPPGKKKASTQDTAAPCNHPSLKQKRRTSMRHHHDEGRHFRSTTRTGARGQRSYQPRRAAFIGPPSQIRCLPGFPRIQLHRSLPSRAWPLQPERGTATTCDTYADDLAELVQKRDLRGDPRRSFHRRRRIARYIGRGRHARSEW